MRKFMAVLIIVVLALSMAAPASSVSLSEEEQRLRREILADEQYQQLLANLSVKDQTHNARTQIIDYYGGAYVNDDGNLVVCVTEDYDPSSNMIETYTGNDDIILQTVKYTYAELSQEQDRIWAVYEELNSAVNDSVTNDLLASLCETCVIQKNNAVVVSLDNITDGKIALFKELFTSADYVTFQEGDPVVQTSSSATYRNSNANVNAANLVSDDIIWELTLGTCIADSSDKYISVGYPVYYLNSDRDFVLGIITIGHEFALNEAVLDADQTEIIGFCKRRAFGGSADVALIEITNPHYEITYVTKRGVTLSSTSYTNSPPEGSSTLVCLDGWEYQVGDGYPPRCASVASTNASYTYNNTRITNMIKLNQVSPSGVRGGPAYRENGSLIGSIAAVGGSYTYVCFIEYALDALYCQLWYCNGEGCEDWECLCNNYIGQD